MRQKSIISIVTLLLSISFAYSQDLSESMQAVYDACNSIRSAINDGNTTGLKSANKKLKDCAVNPLTAIKCHDEDPLSLNEHFVFDVTFIDSLIAGRNVYSFAQRYATPRGTRGVTSSRKIFVKNCAVRKDASTLLSLRSTGHQELAVVTEPKGLVSLRIHDITHDTWYNDTKSVKAGLPTRTMVFDLPANEISILEIEVINCGEGDTSFVVISN